MDLQRMITSKGTVGGWQIQKTLLLHTEVQSRQTYPDVKYTVIGNTILPTWVDACGNCN